eukprot:scaffold32169_cov112-Isochrysis_galbana.AAC.1
MARINRDDMLSAQPRPHGFARAESLDRLYTELKGCAQTLQNQRQRSKPSSINFSMIAWSRAAITSILTDLLLRKKKIFSRNARHASSGGSTGHLKSIAYRSLPLSLLDGSLRLKAMITVARE